MSLSTDASQEPAGLLPGSPRILSGSRTAALPNTGTSCKTRRPKPNRRAACRWLATASLPEQTRACSSTSYLYVKAEVKDARRLRVQQFGTVLGCELLRLLHELSLSGLI